MRICPEKTEIAEIKRISRKITKDPVIPQISAFCTPGIQVPFIPSMILLKSVIFGIPRSLVSVLQNP